MISIKQQEDEDASHGVAMMTRFQEQRRTFFDKENVPDDSLSCNYISDYYRVDTNVHTYKANSN